MKAVYFFFELFEDYLIREFFWFDLFLEARAEILKKFRWFFGQFEDTKKTF